MKINMVQCDICGKMVDYNNKKIIDMVSNKLLGNECLYTDEDFYEETKTNWLIMRGIVDRKNVKNFINDKNNHKNVVINMEFDLCEDCLIELYKMVQKYIKEARK